jgi:VWFA-related protein
MTNKFQRGASRHLLSIIFPQALGIFLTVSLCAQQSISAEGRIKLDVVVTDQSGSPVSGLGRNEFALLDNGQPNEILSFSAFDKISAKPDPPVEVILVIDEVNHLAQDVPDVQPQVEKFLRQNGGHLSQPVSIYRVSDAGLSLTNQPSTDGYTLEDEISHKNRLRQLSLDEDDNTLYDGMLRDNQPFRSRPLHVQTALRALGSIVLEERRKPGRKLLVWVGYGGPDGARSFDWTTELSTRIREARITLFSVTFWRKPPRGFPYQFFLQGVKSAAQSDPGDLALEVLATQSGGHVLENTSDLARMIGQCVEDASTFYTISFNPPRTGAVDEYHDIKVQVSKPDLVARTNTGYYDQPVYYDHSNLASRRVTVEQLERTLAAARGDSATDISRQLSGLELTERMSSASLLLWKARLPGPKAWAALVALADASAFMDPPPAEVGARAPPDLAAQQQMQSRTIDYLLQTIPKLPNFFATRTTLRYRESALKPGQTWKTAIGDSSLYLAGTSRATVLYRNGDEVKELVKGKEQEKGEASLKMSVKFGPVLTTAVDAARGDLVWDHWEQGATGLQAVFHYMVPKEKSHYQVAYCCLLDDGDGNGPFQRLTGYHGEIAIDPESGAILRLTIEAELQDNLPILRHGILVEYGPVEIGGKTYIGIVRGIAILRARTIVGIHEWGERFNTFGPFQTTLDDNSFADYHVFRASSRMLPEYSPATPQDEIRGQPTYPRESPQ